jgi:regulator of protease activity HflC (stomatin/prohibitin superfamily)
MIRNEIKDSFPLKKIIMGIGAAIVLIIFFSTVSSMFFTIDAGEKGVVLKFGKVMGVVDSGLHFKIPIMEQVVKISTRVEKIDVHGEAASKDLQSIVTTLTVNVMVRPDKVGNIYQTLKSDYQDTIVKPVVQEIFKAVTAQYNAEELITKRELVRTEVFNKTRDKLSSYNLLLDNISITNFAFSKGYSDAIEQKQIAEQNSKKAEYDFQRIEVEAKQTIAKAQAEAQSLKLQKEAVTSELLKLREIEVQRIAVDKWDGHLPTTTGGAIPFINVGK